MKVCSLQRLFFLGGAVVLTFGVLLLPFAMTSSLSDVFTRIFPVNRGLFEDKVANFWCSLSVLVKVRNLFDTATLVKLSGVLTLVGCAPSCINVLGRPSGDRLLFALFSCSMCFFLTSFQVHEKNILLPLMPLLLLTPQYVAWGMWCAQIMTFSLFPLLEKDGLVIAYIATSAIWLALRATFSVKDARPTWVVIMMRVRAAVSRDF